MHATFLPSTPTNPITTYRALPSHTSSPPPYHKTQTCFASILVRVRGDGAFTLQSLKWIRLTIGKINFLLNSDHIVLMSADIYSKLSSCYTFGGGGAGGPGFHF